MFGTFQVQHPSPFAGQTGGAFANRTTSLLPAETAAMVAAIDALD
jgi:hypothetical protein